MDIGKQSDIEEAWYASDEELLKGDGLLRSFLRVSRFVWEESLNRALVLLEHQRPT